MPRPIVSVIMGVYHPQKDTALLRRSVLSILAQDMWELELIICDDGSSQETAILLDQIKREDNRIVLLREGNLYTLPCKLNACLRIAKGEWVARMDDDDFSHSDRFTKQLAFLEEHPQIAFVGSNVNLCRNGRVVGVRTLPMFPAVRNFYMTQPYIHPALLFRRVALETVGGYSEDKHCVLCEDYDLLLRLYAKGFRGANIQEMLLDYTIPATAKGSRTMSHRWNETVTRWRRFRELGVLPGALPYVVKPLAVGMLPEKILGGLKKKRDMEK